MNKLQLTTSEAARELGVPVWKVRRMVDKLETAVPRAGFYRLISQETLKLLRDHLRADARSGGE